MRVHTDSRQIEWGGAATCMDTQPYRDMIAGILQQVVLDVEMRSSIEHAVGGYLWVANNDPAFRMYCTLLDINPSKFRDAFVFKYRERTEPLVRMWSDASEEKRALWEEKRARKEAAREREVEREKQRREIVRFNKAKPRSVQAKPHLPNQAAIRRAQRKAAHAAMK